MVVAQYPATSGHTTVIDNLCKELGKMGYIASIGAFSFKKDPPYNIKKIKLSKKKLLISGVSFLDYDIIHPHQSRVLYYLLTKKPKKPIVFHYHGTSNKIQEKNFTLAMKLYKNRISKIISVSKTGITQMKKLVPNIKAEVLYNGVNTQNFSPNYPKLKKKGEPQLLFVSSLRPYKKTIFLLEQMPEILKLFPNAYLQIIGEGEDYNKLKDFIKIKSLENHVELVGKISQSELPKWYSTCDIYVSASTLEACPVSPLEAMSCGKPVVLFNIEPHREILERSESGKIFSNNPKDDFTIKIKQVYDERKNLGIKARNFAVSQDWAEISKKLSTIYETL
jgi:glycosyltransferase involved in cell wall biosynthesis